MKKFEEEFAKVAREFVKYIGDEFSAASDLFAKHRVNIEWITNANRHRDERLQNLTKRFETLEQDIDDKRRKICHLENIFGAHDDLLRTVLKRLDSLEQNVASHEQEIGNVKMRVDEVEMEVEDLDDNTSPYCPECGSCGEEGCCGTNKCKYPQDTPETIEKLRKYEEWLEQDQKFYKEVVAYYERVGGWGDSALYGAIRDYENSLRSR